MRDPHRPAYMTRAVRHARHLRRPAFRAVVRIPAWARAGAVE
jgi:hypothetical protein